MAKYPIIKLNKSEISEMIFKMIFSAIRYEKEKYFTYYYFSDHSSATVSTDQSEITIYSKTGKILAAIE